MSRQTGELFAPEDAVAVADAVASGGERERVISALRDLALRDLRLYPESLSAGPACPDTSYVAADATTDWPPGPVLLQMGTPRLFLDPIAESPLAAHYAALPNARSLGDPARGRVDGNLFLVFWLGNVVGSRDVHSRDGDAHFFKEKIDEMPEALLRDVRERNARYIVWLAEHLFAVAGAKGNA